MVNECKKIIFNDVCPEFYDGKYEQLINTSQDETKKELMRFNK